MARSVSPASENPAPCDMLPVMYSRWFPKVMGVYPNPGLAMATDIGQRSLVPGSIKARVRFLESIVGAARWSNPNHRPSDLREPRVHNPTLTSNYKGGV